jgi:hypothetical protein
MHARVTTGASSQTSSMRNGGEPAEWLVLLQFAALRPNLESLARFASGPIRWSLLLQHAEKHGVIPLLAESVKRADVSIPTEVRDKLRELQRVQAIFTLQLTAELFRALERFRQANIEVLVTKGPALAVRCYGDAGMRQYGDLDLVVREADIRRTTQAMLDLGYEPRIPLTAIDAKKMPGEYAFRKVDTDLLIEFHTEQTFRYHPRPLQIEKLFARRTFVTIDGRSVPALSLEDELVLICVHGAKHFWERLTWIADVAALISRQAPDWNRAIAAAREVGAERMLRLGLRLASDVLAAELPAHVNAEVTSDRTVAKLGAQIESRLSSREPHAIGILQRAVFRIRMRGNLLQGGAYLLRLSLSPTEEDWTPGKEGSRPAFLDAMSRPLRLAKKHGRRPGN